MDTKKPIQVGGHEGCFDFDGNKLKKTTRPEEIDIYRAINGVSPPDLFTDSQRSQLEKLKAFTPKYYSSEGKTLEIENMLTGHEGASVMDMKIGTSSITQDCQKKGDDVCNNRIKKDEKKGSAKYGWRITGYECEGSRYLKTDPTITDRQEHQNKLLVYKGIFQRDSAAFLIEFQNKVILHFESENTFEVRGISIFCVFDHERGHYNAKLIDLASFQDIGKIDEGFNLGLNTLLADLDDFLLRSFNI